MATNINNLAQEFRTILEHYTSDIGERADRVVQEVGEETVEELKITSRKGKRKKYAKSWKLKKDKKGHVVVHNTEYRLTHLLEKGHMKRGGKGRTRPFGHIKPAEQRAVHSLIEKLRREIQGS